MATLEDIVRDAERIASDLPEYDLADAYAAAGRDHIMAEGGQDA